MAGKRGRKRPQSPKIVEQNHDVDESIDTKSTVSASPSTLEPEIATNQLRQRWELASVLNFLQVFKSVIQSKLDISADEIEAALIKPNDDLSQLHISLLKGIPPVNKNLMSPDAWVTILYKKLHPWWPWVADGEIPLNPSQGEEVTTYQELDPINRLLILKALCEVRALQEDSISYLNSSLKQGTDICTFRKERIGGDATGISYWCEGDNVMGYRLYREVKVDYTPRKGKGRLMPQPIYEWETLATNLEEFQQLSDKFSTCDVGVEAAVGEIIENEIIPDLVQTQKKREKALKKQQKQLMSLKGYLNSYTVGATRSCRSRKPVKYTFDEYDKTIKEAIKEGHINKKRKTVTEPKRVKANGSLVNGDVEHDTTSDGDDSTDEEDDKLKSVGGDSDSDSKSDSGDEDYDNKTDEEDNDTNKKGNNGRDKRAKNRFRKTNGDAGLRRSQRVTGNGSRRSSDSDSNSDTVSDNGSSPESSVDKAADGEDPESEDETSSKGSAEKMSVDGSDSESASKGSADEAPADGSDDESDSKGSADEASEDGSEDENASKGSAEKVSADGSDGESASKGSAADGSDDESALKGSADKAAANDSEGESVSKGSVEKVSDNYSEESEEEKDGEKESSDEDEESEEESEDDE